MQFLFIQPFPLLCDESCTVHTQFCLREYTHKNICVLQRAADQLTPLILRPGYAIINTSGDGHLTVETYNTAIITDHKPQDLLGVTGPSEVSLTKPWFIHQITFVVKKYIFSFLLHFTVRKPTFRKQDLQLCWKHFILYSGNQFYVNIELVTKLQFIGHFKWQ